MQHELLEVQDPQVVLLWALFSVLVGVALAIDLGVIGKIRRLLSAKREQEAETSDTKKAQPVNHALAWTIVWISLGMIFAGTIYFLMGYEKMLEYITGYTLEKTLSVDNMFVFFAYLYLFGYTASISAQGIVSRYH
jgi:tellurite resistance protein TerC